ncbi:MAG: FlgD immunoglobulin-like domain containing protein [Candidatus Krumholzibacteriia bacterium]
MQYRSTLTALWTAAAVSLLSAAPSHGELNRYVEDFTTTTYKDAASTTALWKTGAGALELPPFGIGAAGSYGTGNFATEVAVSGDYAYVASGSVGLKVIDISDPINPTLAGQFNTPDFAQGVAVSGDYAYVCDRGGGLRVIDITDPTQPVEVADIALYAFANNVAISGNYAYVAVWAGGLHVIDITDPTNPRRAGNYSTADYAYDVVVSGDYAYLTDSGFAPGLHVVDISDPTNPTPAAFHSTPSSAFGVVVSGDRAYVADWVAGLQVIDISDPAQPSLVAAADTPYTAFDVAVSGDHAYVGDRLGGFHVIDIADPANPALTGTVMTPDQAHGVVVAGEYAYIADWASGLQIIEIGTPTDPAIAGSYGTGNFATEVAVSGDYAYVASGSVGLKVIDISDPINPTLAGQFNTPDFAQGVAVSGDYAYVCDRGGGLRVIDITDPTQPVEVADIALYAFANNVAISGNYAYVAVWAGGLHVIDITDPTNPRRAGNYSTADYAYDVVVSGDYAYLTDSGFAPGLHVVDISDPTNPTPAAFHSTPSSAFGVVVSGDRAYVADWVAGLQVIDISDPAQPSLVAAADTPYTAFDVAVSGDHAYVGDRLGGFHVIDIADPANPALTGTVMTPDQAHGVVVAGEYAYIADWASGLQIAKISERRVTAAANAARSLVVDGTDAAVRRARLTTQEVGSIDWELSADGGVNWQGFVPGAEWQMFAAGGNDIVWRSTLNSSASTPPPVCTRLDIQWLYEFAVIDSIVDVPADQGGWVRVYFTRSDHDFADEGSLPILAYNVHRRIDNAALAARLLADGEPVTRVERVSLPGGAELMLYPPEGKNSRLCRLENRYYLVTATGGTGATRANGVTARTAGTTAWEVVGTVFSQQQDQYVFLAPTFGDAPQTIPYSVYYISAHTTTPTVFFASPPDSGFSVDNLAPAAPQGFQVAYNTGGGNRLTWAPSGDPDVSVFRVYRSADPGVPVEPGSLVGSTPGTEWVDPDHDGWNVYYRVTAVDRAGNESDPASPGTATAIGDVTTPTHSRLYQNAPNPFNPTTTIRYDVAAGGGQVTLRIYDVAGRRVRSLVNGSMDAGPKSVTWDGTNDRGRRVASGVYFYRLQAPGYVKTLKMTLLQ